MPEKVLIIGKFSQRSNSPGQVTANPVFRAFVRLKFPDRVFCPKE